MNHALPAGYWDAVLFDLDGTLADTVELILTCYRHTMRTHLGHVPPDQRWLSTLGTPLRDQLREFATSAGEAQAMLETYAAFQRTVHDHMVAPCPGARELVDTLRGQAVPMALVTSKRKEMTLRTLDRCGFSGAFEVIVSADDVEEGKPHPEPVFAALRPLGLAPSAAVILVGDSPHDMVAGRRAGVSTGAALWGPFDRETLKAAGADHFLETPADLLDLTPKRA